MHKDHLPLKIDPFRFADQSLSLNGVLLIKDMQRLCSGLYSNEGEVKVDMQFAVDEEKLRYVKGCLSTCLTLQCQRCLEPFKYEIMRDFMLGMVHTEKEADRLPDRYDPLIVTDSSLLLSEMIEEELIINLPVVPMHQLDDCKAKALLETYSKKADTEKESPFKVIESLRSKRN